MINTQPILSQFHLANASSGTGNHYLSDKRQHQQILHKHSQSLDANGPYIAISECHSGKSFMQKQQQPKATVSSQAASGCSLGQDRLASTNRPSALSLKPAPLSSVGVFGTPAAINPLSSNEQPSIYNSKQQQQMPSKPTSCESKVFLHARSSSNIVLGSKKQYGPKASSHPHHLNSSTICSTPTGSNPKYCLSSDKPTNRHFKIYEKNELANSTSLIDVSLASCLGNSKCECDCNKNFNGPNFRNFGSSYFINNGSSNYSSVNYSPSIASHLKSANPNYLQRSINSTGKQWNASSLEEKFDNLSLNSLLSANRNYLNSNPIGSLAAPPRPPKPDNLKIGKPIADQLNISSSANNSSFNESFSSNNFILPSDEEYSPTSSKLYSSYGKFNSPTSQSQHPRLPKNSLSSSCSSNASPFCNGNGNAQDSVFVYDQNIGNFQPFHHSPPLSRLNSFEDTDSSENSPTYFNNSALINLNNLSASNQTSPGNYNLPANPPAVNRNLKPRKNLSNQPSFSCNRNSSYHQPNALISTSLIGDLEEELYNNNFSPDDRYRKAANDSSIQYLDLDLASIQDEDEVSCSQQSSFKEDFKDQLNSTISSNESKELKESYTVYKTVDFVKTNAFNKLRSNLERQA